MQGLKISAIILLLCLKTQAQDSVTVKPGIYRNWFLHNWIFGKRYRDIWAEPVKVPVMKFSDLKPKTFKLGGSRESKSLHYIVDGKEYTMRSVDKDLSNALPRWLRKTFLRRVMKDMSTCNFPYAPLAAGYLENSLGLSSVKKQMVFLLPDTAFNGDFSVFNNLIVIAEERPSEAWVKKKEFYFADRILNSCEVYQMFQKNEIIFDADLYLKLRLIDILIGDWSRHPDQYKWALVKIADEQFIAKPIPRDRDHAFYKFKSGLLPRIVYLFNKKYKTFGKKIGNFDHLFISSKHIDDLVFSQISNSQVDTAMAWFEQEVRPEILRNSIGQFPSEIDPNLKEDFIRSLYLRREEIISKGKNYLYTRLKETNVNKQPEKAAQNLCPKHN